MQDAKRILLKISGEMLNKQGSAPYQADALQRLAKTLVELQATGKEIVIVVGGGNIWRAKDMEAVSIPRVTSDYVGMTATVINAVVLGQSINQAGGKAVAYGPAETTIPTGSESYDIMSARENLTEGKIVICSGGIFQPYSTTDSAAVQRALELECDVVVKTTKVDGLYDKDPQVHTDAKRFDAISYDEALRLQVAVMDQHALALARANDVVLYICHMDELAMLWTKDIKGTRVYV